MFGNSSLKPIDTLIIGHVTNDLQPDGSSKLGGTVSFSGLSSHMLGQKTAVLTSHAPDLDLSALESLELVSLPSNRTTTFKNIPTEAGRLQFCYAQASLLTPEGLPDAWRRPNIVHFGPVANEIDPEFFSVFPDSLLCLTPQGFLRQFAEDGQVRFRDWPEKESCLPKTDAVVLSLEDLAGDEALIRDYVRLCELLVVTENKNGARVYWKQEMRRFPAPTRKLVEDTGAGDIFAACFFQRYSVTRNAWQAAQFAVELAANSVTRHYLDSIPTKEEIENARKAF